MCINVQCTLSVTIHIQRLQCGVYDNYSEATESEFPGQILRHGSEYQIARSTLHCIFTVQYVCRSSSTSSSLSFSSSPTSSSHFEILLLVISNCPNPHCSAFSMHCVHQQSSPALFHQVFTFYRTPLLIITLHCDDFSFHYMHCIFTSV